MKKDIAIPKLCLIVFDKERFPYQRNLLSQIHVELCAHATYIINERNIVNVVQLMWIQPSR